MCAIPCRRATSSSLSRGAENAPDDHARRLLTNGTYGGPVFGLLVCYSALWPTSALSAAISAPRLSLARRPPPHALRRAADMFERPIHPAPGTTSVYSTCVAVLRRPLRRRPLGTATSVPSRFTIFIEHLGGAWRVRGLDVLLHRSALFDDRRRGLARSSERKHGVGCATSARCTFLSAPRRNYLTPTPARRRRAAYGPRTRSWSR